MNHSPASVPAHSDLAKRVTSALSALRGSGPSAEASAQLAEKNRKIAGLTAELSAANAELQRLTAERNAAAAKVAELRTRHEQLVANKGNVALEMASLGFRATEYTANSAAFDQWQSASPSDKGRIFRQNKEAILAEAHARGLLGAGLDAPSTHAAA